MPRKDFSLPNPQRIRDWEFKFTDANPDKGELDLNLSFYQNLIDKYVKVAKRRDQINRLNYRDANYSFIGIAISLVLIFIATVLVYLN